MAYYEALLWGLLCKDKALLIKILPVLLRETRLLQRLPTTAV